MKVVSYNLHKGIGPRKRDILPDVVEAVAALDPDILVCQEVLHRLDVATQSQFITTSLGHRHAFGPNVFRTRGDHGNAVFTRLHMARYANLNLTESFLERRGMLRVWLEDAGRPFELLAVHFSLTGTQRRRQWHRLLQALPEDPAMPVLACGDFNDWSGHLDRLAKRSGVLTNALWQLSPRMRRTFPARRPLLGLDRIYYRGFTLRSIRVLTGEPWNRLSDHLPVEAVFEPG